MNRVQCAMKIQLVWFALTENDICLRLKTEKIKVWTSFITLYYDSLWARTIDERKHFDQKVWFLLQFDRYLFPVLVMIIPLNKTTSYYRFDMNEDERMSAITINAISGISFFAVKNYDIFFKPRFFRKLSGTANFLFHILKEHIRFHIWQWVWEESVTRIRKKIQKKSKWEGDSIIFHSTV